MTKSNLMRSSVSVFHISVQWLCNVDQFMQTFDSWLIKNPVKMFVVRCLILCFKLVKKSFVGRAPPGPAAWGSLQRSPRPPSWIMGKGKERRGKMAEGERRGGKGRGEKWDGKERKGEGRVSPSQWRSWIRPCMPCRGDDGEVGLSIA